ncbi:MAG: hypothetical protein NZV14_05360 [Bryobacteraceae bacterium]|nr:hypothetical protein [Bryobacteraceae bacterium]MDW8377565.1 hypothetical protein [Bryobacterales bacterium]
MISRRSLWILAPVIAVLTACSEAPKQEAKKKEPEKPPEPVTGRKAFYLMYPSARAWAIDAQPLQLSSISLPEVKSEQGKYGAWQCSFVSPSKGKLKTFTYSVIEAGGNLHKGVFALHEEGFSGSRGQAKPWLVAALKVDSDQAWETAAKKSVEYMKKHPNMPITFLLEYTNRFPQPAWRVIWGESVGTSSYSIFVDAATGEYLATGR